MCSNEFNYKPNDVPNRYSLSITLFNRTVINATVPWAKCDCYVIVPIPAEIIDGGECTQEKISRILQYLTRTCDNGLSVQGNFAGVLPVSENNILEKCLKTIFLNNKAFWYNNREFCIQTIEKDETLMWRNMEYRFLPVPS